MPILSRPTTASLMGMTRQNMTPESFASVLNSPAEFLPRLYWHAVQAGLEDPSYRQIVLIGDGAHWIWEEGSAHLRVAAKTWVEILDFHYASQHLWAVAEAIWPDEKHTQM